MKRKLQVIFVIVLVLIGFKHIRAAETITDKAPKSTINNERASTVAVDSSHSIARQWNEILLQSIRRDLARPTVHARNLFHSSAAMWDAWALVTGEGCPFLIGQLGNGYDACGFEGFSPADTPEEAVEEAISYAMYRILRHRFINSNNSIELLTMYSDQMQTLGYDTSITQTDYSTGSAAALGNYIAQCYIDFGLWDNSNEQNSYGNTSYEPINPPLATGASGNPDVLDMNRWQPLARALFIDQSGNVIPLDVGEFLSPEWGDVSSFSLKDNMKNTYQRDGFDYHVFHDPGAPPYIQADGGGASDEYKWGFSTVVTWSSHLDPTDTVMLDISPATLGNSAALPTDFADFPNYYDQLNGGATTTGRTVNPATGLPYAPNIVKRGDYTRVIAEFWADGPDSETPPGHWFTILNELVSDHPDVVKRFEGQGDILDDLEWDVKAYFMLGGAMHDAAITAWGAKGWYDYIRPISAIRAMAEKGQSTDPTLPSYDPRGIPLIEGYIELVEAGDPLAGFSNTNVGEIKVKAWRGHDYVINPDTDYAGVDWILAEDWTSYQRSTFVTPPFAGYVSGHSTFSRAAATVLAAFTGDAYFPGGMGTFFAEQSEFLVFENGPSTDVELQWATYQDAANESALSRIWGGIHPPADDAPGRLMGLQVGTDAFEKAKSYFLDTDNDGFYNIEDACNGIDDNSVLDLNLRVFLEGAFDAASFQMSTGLNSRGLLPGQTPLAALATPTPAGQPYHIAPWNYTGTEGANWTDADYSADIVDWVLVSLRTGLDKNTEVIQFAGLLGDSGIIETPERCNIIVPQTDVYVVVEHRSHMGIMTANPVTITGNALSYNFTQTNTYNGNGTGAGQKEILPGFWVMFAGDADQSDFPSYDINGDDKAGWFELNGSFDMYVPYDFNLDGDISGADKALWESNNGISGRVPK